MVQEKKGDSHNDERKEPSYFYENISLEVRVKRAIITIGGTLAVCTIIWTIQYFAGVFQSRWCYFLPLAVLGISWGLFELFQTQQKFLTPFGEAEIKRLEALNRESEQEEQFFLGLRVVIFILVFVFSGDYFQGNDRLPWVSFILASLAAYFYKIILYGLILILIGTFFYYIAGVAQEIPVSVAIIIAAIIIASAIRR